MKYRINYDLSLPEEVSSILEREFWMLEDVDPSMFQGITDPVKFSATTMIFIKSGECKADINLITYDIVGPAFVIVRNSQIMLPKYISPDFRASVMVMSKNFNDNISLFLNHVPIYGLISRHPVVSLPKQSLPEIDKFFKDLREILADVSNPYASQALVFTIVAFTYKTLYKCYEPFQNEFASGGGRISDRFIALVQEHFRKERFLDFYASKLEITPKHLSRTVKCQTGYTAVEWIEKFVILEAKVLLKSSNLNIQQIADELNFPSQSFFGKYFKKITGLSPKEFRNG